MKRKVVILLVLMMGMAGVAGCTPTPADEQSPEEPVNELTPAVFTLAELKQSVTDAGYTIAEEYTYFQDGIVDGFTIRLSSSLPENVPIDIVILECGNEETAAANSEQINRGTEFYAAQNGKVYAYTRSSDNEDVRAMLTSIIQGDPIAPVVIDASVSANAGVSGNDENDENGDGDDGTNEGEEG